jgi:Ran GTPase-activating protein (RanGAP) involved in mRNA processing and transport
MIDKFFLSKLCNIVSLNISHQRFDEGNIDALQKYIIESPVLETLTLNNCRLRDTFGAKILISWFSQKNKTNKFRGQIHLEGNLLGESLF